jgi:hypothetical protein
VNCDQLVIHLEKGFSSSTVVLGVTGGDRKVLGDNWVTLFPGDIKPGTCPFELVDLK